MFRPAAASVLLIVLGLTACSDDSHPAPSSSGADTSLPASGDGNASAFNGGAGQAAPAPASGQPPLAPPEIHYPPADDAAASSASSTASTASTTSAEPPPGGPGNPGTPAPPPGMAPSGQAGSDANAPSGIPPSRLPAQGASAGATRG